MKEMKRAETRCGYIFILEIMVLAFLMLVSIAGATPFAYITNYGNDDVSEIDTVSVIDTATNTFITTIDVGRGPTGVAITPDGSKVYVLNSFDSTVSVIDTTTNKVIATVDVENGPIGVAVSPDGTKVYVTQCRDEDGNTAISIIDTAKNKVTDTINIGHYDSLGDIAVTPDGKRVYVLAEGGPTSVIDTATNTIIATVNVGSYPGGIVITPDGKKAYVANGYNNVSVIDTATNIVVATVSDRIGSVSGIAVAPNGSKVYVANYGYGANNIYDGGGNISVIDTLTNKVTVMVPLGKYTYGVAITPDGTKLYVANDYSNVSVIDTSTNKVTSTVNIGTRHLGIAIGNKKVQNVSHTTPSEFNSLLVVILILYIWRKSTKI